MLEFDPSWGWGSSSTLLHLLEQWLEIDPYQLMDETIGGSGYDIACAGANSPIFYQRTANRAPQIMPTHFNPPFIKQMGIVYLNKKQNSSTQVKLFLESASTHIDTVDEISKISQSSLQLKDINAFISLMQQHEAIIAKLQVSLLFRTTILRFQWRNKIFRAWGGDFALFLSEEEFKTNKKWFESKGYLELCL